MIITTSCFHCIEENHDKCKYGLAQCFCQCKAEQYKEMHKQLHEFIDFVNGPEIYYDDKMTKCVVCGYE